MNRANRMQNICQTAHTFTVFKRPYVTVWHILTISIRLTLTQCQYSYYRMLVLKGYLTLRHETSQSIIMTPLIGCHPATGQNAGLGM